MKPRNIVMIVIVSLIAIYGGGYWLFIRERMVNLLPADPGDSLGLTGIRGAVKNFFEPARELDLQLTHDIPLRNLLIGYWANESEDFVHMSRNGTCHFKLGVFRYSGRVTYSRSYAGFYTEFHHEGKEHIFILTPDFGAWDQKPLDRLVVGFVGHDPRPGHRESDHECLLARKPEKTKEAER